MEHTSELIALILAVLACLFVVLKAVRTSRDAEKERIAKEQEEVDRAKARLGELHPELLRLHDEIARLSDYDCGYLMKRGWDSLLASAEPTLSAVAKLPREVVKASEYVGLIDGVAKRCQDPSFRETRNRSYKERELKLCDALLSDIDGGKSLDPQQRDAIVTDEYSNLVIAGAGSGKTSVVVGKVKYLVERWHVDPSEILVTSFTRASVDDLKARIEDSGVAASRRGPSTRSGCAPSATSRWRRRTRCSGTSPPTSQGGSPRTRTRRRHSSSSSACGASPRTGAPTPRRPRRESGSSRRRTCAPSRAWCRNLAAKAAWAPCSASGSRASRS